MFSATAGADADPSGSDVAYAEIELKLMTNSRRIKGRAKTISFNSLNHYINYLTFHFILTHQI